MASGSDRAVALMAIHPQFAERILAGEKQVEFRKTRFRSQLTHVVIYCTEPVGQVVGFFEVESLDKGSPDELWDRYENVAGICSSDFKSYYNGSRNGVAIRIGKVHRLKKPIPLTALRQGARPPQSFCYLEPRVIEQLSDWPDFAGVAAAI